jgi:sucrose-6F-phosphate phosphohydrolase
MPERILLCSDLDRTLLPNGPQEESPQARPLLRSLAERDALILAYVTGRHLRLIDEAIREYDLPAPDFAIGDVGTTLYERRGDGWHPSQAWKDEIGADWAGASANDLADLFSDWDALRLQEPEKQGLYKLSYYTAEDIDHKSVLATMHARMQEGGVRVSLIWSVDEAKHLGLVDVLPERATKLHAVQFLIAQLGMPQERVVFAGDSGNDLPALTSGLQAVLVRNALDSVRQEALATLQQEGLNERLYVAEGGFLNMNGNYSAGVLEGLVHFLPEVRDWLEPS